MTKQSFIMMIGVAGAGKSTLARSMAEEMGNTEHISSDDIREELFGSADIQRDHNKVFDEMLTRTTQALKDGKHVLYDSTNLNRKRRAHLLRQLPKEVDRVAYYVSTEYRDIYRQNNMRDRIVPDDVINKMYKTLHLPIYSEGWDRIEHFHHKNIRGSHVNPALADVINDFVECKPESQSVMYFLASYFDEFSEIIDMPQDSEYHSFSVSRHTFYVYEYVHKNYQGDDYDKGVMLWTALLHDIGKPFCKSFINYKGDRTRYANFIGHELVGSQIATQLLYRLNFSEEFIYEVSTLIQFHMYLLNENASKSKLERYVGEKMFKQLEFLRDADNSAH